MQSNLKLSLDDAAYSYCWYPEEFSDGKKLKDSRYKECCNFGTYVNRSDHSIVIKSPSDDKKYCLGIDGMPFNTYDDMLGKNVKLFSCRFL